MTPDVTALLDQAHAAAEHGMQIFQKSAELAGSPATLVVPTGPRAAVLARLGALAATGQVTYCPHLHGSRPVPQFWAAWRPGRIRCSPCLATVSLATKGTEEDNRCDHCRQVDPKIWACQVMLPGFMLPDQRSAYGPTTVYFGLCRPCLAASENPLTATLPAEQDRPRGTGRVRPPGQRGRRRGKGGTR